MILKNKWVLGFMTGASAIAVVNLGWWGITHLLLISHSNSIQANQTPTTLPSPVSVAPLTPENGLPRPLIVQASPTPSPTDSPDPTAFALPPTSNQGSAKALPVLQPTQIEFPSGAKKTALAGTLDSLVTKPFLINCRQGQTLTIRPSENQVSVNIFAPNGVFLGSTEIDPDQIWKSTLIQSGNYRLEVNVSQSGPYRVQIQVL